MKEREREGERERERERETKKLDLKGQILQVFSSFCVQQKCNYFFQQEML
jgi:hypothetical protein